MQTASEIPGLVPERIKIPAFDSMVDNAAMEGFNTCIDLIAAKQDKDLVTIKCVERI